MSKSTAALIAPDVAYELKAMNQGKPIGMSEKEWNAIVQKNYSNHLSEQQVKKERLATQREQMKDELQRQVTDKAEKDRTFKAKDRAHNIEQLDAIERKQYTDEIVKRSHNDELKKGINAGQQYETQHQRRFDDI